MAIKGYTFYLDGVKQNIVPQGSPTYTFTGLASNSNHTIDVEVVDYANNVSTPGELNASTLAYAPGEQPLSVEDQNIVDGIVAEKLAASPASDGGALVGIVGPKGYYYKAYGSAYGRPLTLDDRMRWGSTTKMALSVLILKEVEAGHLSLNDTLEEFIPGVVNGKKTTIKHLLMMRSSIPDYLNDDVGNLLAILISPTVPFNPLPKIKSYGSTGQDPGFSGPARYSNSNSYLLALIMEQLDATYGTGRPWRQIVNEDFCQALGLLESGVQTGATMPAPYSKGMMNNPAYPIIQSLGWLGWLAPIFVPGLPTAQVLDMTNCDLTFAKGAGDMNGTIHDFVKYGEVLRDGELLSPEMKQLREEYTETMYLYTPASPDQGDGWAGLGLGLLQMGQWYGWRGQVPAYTSMLLFNPTNGAVVSILINDWDGPTIEALLPIRYALYPDTVHITPTIRRLSASSILETPGAAIPSGEAFGTPAAYVYHTPGDADTKTDVALKVPFYI